MKGVLERVLAEMVYGASERCGAFLADTGLTGDEMRVLAEHLRRLMPDALREYTAAGAEAADAGNTAELQRLFTEVFRTAGARAADAALAQLLS